VTDQLGPNGCEYIRDIRVTGKRKRRSVTSGVNLSCTEFECQSWNHVGWLPLADQKSPAARLERLAELRQGLKHEVGAIP
jgi:hypothetical protein